MSSIEYFEKVATPFQLFCPKTFILYPYSSNILCGKPAVSTFNSWTSIVSYSFDSRIFIKLSAWARIELILMVSIFIFAIFPFMGIITLINCKNNKDFES